MSLNRFLRSAALAATVAALFAFVPPASAGKAYIGAAYTNTDSEFDTAVDSFDPDDSGWKVYGGFNIIRWLGLEASYRELGNLQQTVPGATFDIDVEAFDVAARAIAPVGIVSLFAKAGYANIALDGSLDVGGTITDFDEDEWELFYGVGVDIHLGKRFGLRAEWEEYDTDDDLNTLSGGAFFRF